MSMPATRHHAEYPKYKATSGGWLYAIPDHWRIRRLKTIAKVALSNVDKKTVEGQLPVRLCNYTDVYHNERITSQREFMAASATPEQVRRFSLRRGDVLITKDSESWNDIAVPAYISEDLPGVICGYHLAHVRPIPAFSEGSYLARAFSAVGVRDQFWVSANGITRYGLSGDAITCGAIPTPPLEEQRSIAAFLDAKTAEIDALIEKIRRLLVLLEEKRTALITEVVTTGLATSLDASTTGSAFFSRIPRGWTLKKLRRLITQVKRPICVDPDAEYREIGIRSWGKGIFHKEAIRGALLEDKNVFQIEPGDFVLNIVFAWEGAVALAAEHERGMIGSHRFPTFRCTAEIDPQFLLLVLRTEQGRALLELNSPGAAGRNKTLRLHQLLNEEIPLPPRSVQQEIVEAVSAEEGRAASLASGIDDIIDRLREYRTALISAAVTGKIDVRSYQTTPCQ